MATQNWTFFLRRSSTTNCIGGMDVRMAPSGPAWDGSAAMSGKASTDLLKSRKPKKPSIFYHGRGCPLLGKASLVFFLLISASCRENSTHSRLTVLLDQ